MNRQTQHEEMRALVFKGRENTFCKEGIVKKDEEGLLKCFQLQQAERCGSWAQMPGPELDPISEEIIKGIFGSTVNKEIQMVN